MDYKENVIEWLTGQDTATVTVHQKKFANKIKRMAERGAAEIIAENDDGTIMAHISIKAIHLYQQAWNGAGIPVGSDDDTDEDEDEI